MPETMGAGQDTCQDLLSVSLGYLTCKRTEASMTFEDEIIDEEGHVGYPTMKRGGRCDLHPSIRWGKIRMRMKDC